MHRKKKKKKIEVRDMRGGSGTGHGNPEASQIKYNNVGIYLLILIANI